MAGGAGQSAGVIGKGDGTQYVGGLHGGYRLLVDVRVGVGRQPHDAPFSATASAELPEPPAADEARAERAESTVCPLGGGCATSREFP